MPKKISKRSKKKQRDEQAPDGIVFRERPLKDFNLQPKHPKPIPGYKATLPGPPGWQYKIDPGA